MEWTTRTCRRNWLAPLDYLIAGTGKAGVPVCALFALLDDIIHIPHWRTHDLVLRLSMAKPLFILIHASPPHVV
jgi:hypothetical protein